MHHECLKSCCHVSFQIMILCPHWCIVFPCRNPHLCWCFVVYTIVVGTYTTNSRNRCIGINFCVHRCLIDSKFEIYNKLIITRYCVNKLLVWASHNSNLPYSIMLLFYCTTTVRIYYLHLIVNLYYVNFVLLLTKVFSLNKLNQFFLNIR